MTVNGTLAPATVTSAGPGRRPAGTAAWTAKRPLYTSSVGTMISAPAGGTPLASYAASAPDGSVSLGHCTSSARPVADACTVEPTAAAVGVTTGGGTAQEANAIALRPQFEEQATGAATAART